MSRLRDLAMSIMTAVEELERLGVTESTEGFSYVETAVRNADSEAWSLIEALED